MLVTIAPHTYLMNTALLHTALLHTAFEVCDHA
jgi:hypothetical protein